MNIYLKRVLQALIVIAYGVYFFLSSRMEALVLKRQTRSPDESMNFTAPIELKGVTFYVTSDEAHLYNLSQILFWVFWGGLILGALVQTIISKRSKPSS